MSRRPVEYRLRPSSPYTISSGVNHGVGTRSAPQSRTSVETPTSAVSARAAPVRGRGKLRRRILSEGARGPRTAGPSIVLADYGDVERAVARDVTCVEGLHADMARVVPAS